MQSEKKKKKFVNPILPLLLSKIIGEIQRISLLCILVRLNTIIRSLVVNRNSRSACYCDFCCDVCLLDFCLYFLLVYKFSKQARKYKHNWQPCIAARATRTSTCVVCLLTEQRHVVALKHVLKMYANIWMCSKKKFIKLDKASPILSKRNYFTYFTFLWYNNCSAHDFSTSLYKRQVGKLPVTIMWLLLHPLIMHLPTV